MKEPVWLKDGQTVAVEIEKIGKIANKLVFY
jgi:2-keto-4-pentenoate hydratase/2-oxohepta-3-ene-1,7-dioic acid hydratase in catechol pathway